jgi:hypothetical protein
MVYAHWVVAVRSGAAKALFRYPQIGEAGSTHPPDALNFLPNCLNRIAARTDNGMV